MQDVTVPLFSRARSAAVSSALHRVIVEIHRTKNPEELLCHRSPPSWSGVSPYSYISEWRAIDDGASKLAVAIRSHAAPICIRSHHSRGWLRRIVTIDVQLLMASELQSA